jgi:hypothetical protein
MGKAHFARSVIYVWSFGHLQDSFTQYFTMTRFFRQPPAAGNTTKPVWDVSPAIAETYQMIRETGNLRSIDNDTHEY